MCGYKYTSSLKPAQVAYRYITNGIFPRHPAVSAVKERSFYYSNFGFLLCRPDTIGTDHYIVTFPSGGVTMDHVADTLLANDEDILQVELYKEIFLRRRGSQG